MRISSRLGSDRNTCLPVIARYSGPSVRLYILWHGRLRAHNDNAQRVYVQSSLRGKYVYVMGF